MAQNIFQFVTSDGPKVPRTARTMIRKQAMKEIGLTRRKKPSSNQTDQQRQLPYDADNAKETCKGDWPVTTVTSQLLVRVAGARCKGSVSIIQGSASSTLASTTTDLTYGDNCMYEEEIVASDLKSASLPTCTHTLMWSRTLTMSDYEHTRSKFGIDLASLSALTHFTISVNYKKDLSANPFRLNSLPRDRQRSYLDFVPARYGKAECLTAATNAVLAKIQIVLSPERGSTTACSRLYGVALRALQRAIGNEATSMEPDVLCATQLLGMHELLAPTSDTAWSHHVRGTAQLFKHRSHLHFTSEFEKWLLAAHARAMVHRYFTDTLPCYLERPEWAALYGTVALQDPTSPFLTARSPLYVNLLLSLFGMPRLWHDIKDAVDEPSFLCNTNLLFETRLKGLETRCRKIHSDLVGHLGAYKAHCLRLVTRTPDLPDTEIAMRRSFYRAADGGFMIILHLLATICDTERHELIAGAHAVARSILARHKQETKSSSWLFSRCEVELAYYVLQLEARWMEDLRGGSIQVRKLASRMRFNAWTSAFQKDAKV